MHTSHRALPRSPDNSAYRYSSEENGECFAFWHVWPNMTFGRLPGSPNFGVFSIDPVSVGETRARGDRFTTKEADSPEEAARRTYVDNVLWPEDKAICESVQRGLRSRGYEQGPLVAPEPYDGNNEIVCQLFQRLTREALEAES
jgi:phenylpropionate dioxygenase-like ring-hydroxylating dioxygenase large terminal subunit